VINECASDVVQIGVCAALNQNQIRVWALETGSSGNNAYFHLIIY
jgi:hypothetical protein